MYRCFGHLVHKEDPKRIVQKIQPMVYIVKEYVSHAIEKIDGFDFDPFTWDSHHHNKGIFSLCETIFEYEGLFTLSFIDKHKCLHFFNKMDDEYTRLSNTFHNKYHILFTLHGMFALIQRIGVFTRFEKLALYLSALVHDMQHPGFTNRHMVMKQDKWAKIYNDQSPLENMHVFIFFHLIMTKPEYNFLSKINHHSFLRLRHIIVRNVLSTDIDLHHEILAKFKNTYGYDDANIDVLSLNTPMYRPSINVCHSSKKKMSLMQIMMKCADFSHLWARQDFYVVMIKGLEEELLKQGDYERRKWGKVMSPMSDRKKSDCSLLKNQDSFFETMVFPLFLGLSLVCPQTTEILTRSMQNYNHIKKHVKM